MKLKKSERRVMRVDESREFCGDLLKTVCVGTTDLQIYKMIRKCEIRANKQGLTLSSGIGEVFLVTRSKRLFGVYPGE